MQPPLYHWKVGKKNVSSAFLSILKRYIFNKVFFSVPFKIRECLSKLRAMGYNDRSGWLLNIVENVSGDLDKALHLLTQEQQDTDVE